MTKLSDGRVFTCPECGCDNIEERRSVTQYRNILLCEEVDYAWCATTYGQPRFESSYADIERLQCSNCGEYIVEDTLEKHFKEATDETTTAQ